VSLDLESSSPSMETFLLGEVDYARCLALQHHLARQSAVRCDGQIALLLCEHPPVVTVGRAGSPDRVCLNSGPVRERRIATQWVNRGGGCLVHAPGQLAIYPIVPLGWHHWSIGDYLARLQTAITLTVQDLGGMVQAKPGRFGVWGRTGQLAAFGIAVRNWVSYHGVFLNVCPSMGLFRLTQESPEAGPMSCLVAERGRPVRMTSARAAVVGRLADALGCPRYHMYTGHPWLRESESRMLDRG
jgi:lipoyl(octanoyl) transferase